MNETTLYPAITEPLCSGLLEVGDGQEIYWEECGNHDGQPVVFVHGGPGGGAPAFNRRFFDPDRYRIILFDQRGCGRSRPHVADPDIDLDAALSVNTTENLIADMEKLRSKLGIDRWVVFGGSWGSTLSLAYAQAHPDRVKALILRGIFLLRKTELDWYYNGGAAHIFPDMWQTYLAPVPSEFKPPADDIHGRTHLEDIDLIEVYHRLLHSKDRAIAVAAAHGWSVWEGMTSKILVPDSAGDHGQVDYDLAFARIENHYFVNKAFMADGELLKKTNMDKIRAIPAVIVQGRYDVVCPAISAWQLHEAWPEAEFHLSPVAGHASLEEQNLAALIAATDRFADVP